MSIKIAIISDLHCTTKDSPRSYLTLLHTAMPGVPLSRHPVQALKKLISDEKLVVDFILCPGDIADQINEQGLYTGWQYIEDIANSLNTTKIYATLGNHDVAFKANNPSNAFNLAKHMNINYPLPIEQHKSFWGDYFSVLEFDDYRLLVINTVYNYYDTDGSKKIEVNDVLLEKIEAEISNTDIAKVGITLSHHHPMSHASRDFKDCDFIDKGDSLLKLLEKYNFNLYVHGHKHEPMLRTLNNVNIFASGSFSCLENLKETESENMFHIIELDANGKGVVKSWEYGPKSGWHQKYSNYSFPNNTGFGFKGEINDLASRINDWLNDEKKDFASVEKLSENIPEIKHLKPEEQNNLQSYLEKNFHLEVSPNFSSGDKAKVIKQII